MRGPEACFRGSSLRLNGYDGPFEVGHLDREQFVARRFGDGGEPVRVFLLDLLEKVADDTCISEVLAPILAQPTHHVIDPYARCLGGTVFRSSNSFAAATTCSGLNPNFFWSSLSGAEAPNVFMPMMRPSNPVYRSHPKVEACSTATRALTLGGSTLSR